MCSINHYCLTSLHPPLSYIPDPPIFGGALTCWEGALVLSVKVVIAIIKLDLATKAGYAIQVTMAINYTCEQNQLNVRRTRTCTS